MALPKDLLCLRFIHSDTWTDAPSIAPDCDALCCFKKAVGIGIIKDGEGKILAQSFTCAAHANDPIASLIGYQRRDAIWQLGFDSPTPS